MPVRGSAAPRAIVAGLFVTYAFAASASFVSARPTSVCDELRQWAQRYSGATLTLHKFAAFDRPHRRAVFNAIAPAVRASLWQEQFRRFNERADLSPAQHALLRDAIALTTPALYERRPDVAQAFAAFWRSADVAFPSADHRRAFFELGSTVNLDLTPATGGTPLRFSSGATLRSVSCECNTSFGVECAGCTGASGSCTIAVGCGPAGWYPCNGVCP